jgi:hypothetical protein
VAENKSREMARVSATAPDIFLNRMKADSMWDLHSESVKQQLFQK